MADVIKINGAAHSWSSTILKIGGERYSGIDSIGYSDKRERVHGYGMGRSHAPNWRSAGKYSVENVKIRGRKSTIEAIRQQLALLSPDGRSYGNAEVNINLQFVEGIDTPMNVLIVGCSLVSDGSSHEENPDPLKDEIEFQPMRIIRNGKTLYDSSQGL